MIDAASLATLDVQFLFEIWPTSSFHS